MKRRGFLANILAAGFAPAAVSSGILMPVKQIILPPEKRISPLYYKYTIDTEEVLRGMSDEQMLANQATLVGLIRDIAHKCYKESFHVG